MKATLNITVDSEEKLRLLIRVAEEMGMDVESRHTLDPFTAASETVLAEDWNSPEDSRWDEEYAHLKR